MVVRHLQQKIRDKHFSSRERQHENPAYGGVAAKGKSRAMGRETVEICVQGTTDGQCSRGDKCGMKHDPEKNRESKGKEKGSRPSNSPRRNALDRRSPTEKSPSGKENQTTCFPKRNACNCWHPPECSCIKKGIAHLGVSVRLSIQKGLGANQRKERKNSTSSPKHWITLKHWSKPLR